MEPKDILKSLSDDLKKAVEHTLQEYNSLHTGKATPAMLDNVRVHAYGSTMTLKEIAAVTTPDARTIMVQPWDKSVIRDVEKGIQEANLGLNPLIDGGILRVPVPELTGERRQELAKTAGSMAVPVPELTGERRQELAKTAGSMAEEGRVRVRQARRDALDLLKSAKDDGLPEDDLKRHEKEVQKAHDDAIAEINDHLATKEADLKKV